MDADIPIDIHYNKLLDWLISRRHCQQQWQASALVVREKINTALQDMPPVEEITSLLSGTYINYFHCLRIVELLKETESGTKNIFGQYSSKRIKDWQTVVKLYEKEALYLAEAAQMIIRNVSYEVPSLKKQILKCQQTQKDCIRKESDYASQSSEMKAKYRAKCKNMGIEGNKIKRELVSLVKDLPTVYDKVGSQIADLKASIDYYTNFIEFTLKNPDEAKKSLSLLKYIQIHGNTTIYQYKTGEVPKNIVNKELTFDMTLDEDMLDDAKENEIDWGQIDFDITADPPNADIIDFGDTDIGDENGIDWGNVPIEVVDAQENNSSESEGTAAGKDALTILDNAETRNSFIDELFELQAFLTQRLQELRTDFVLSSSQFQSAPSSLQVMENDVAIMLQNIAPIIVQLTSNRMQELIHIRSSPRYVDRLTSTLQHILDNSEKCLASSRLMVQKRKDALQEEVEIEPKLKLIKNKTLDLKNQIEMEISKKYQNRRVNIMGEINTM